MAQHDPLALPPPTLPGWRPSAQYTRPSASQIQRTTNKNRTLTYAGSGEVIPIVWGEQIVGGPVIAGPVVDNSGYLVYAVAISWAGDNGIEDIIECSLGDETETFSTITDPDAGASVTLDTHISVKVYDGRQTIPDAQLVAAINAFDDVFEGIAYARIRISPSSSFSSYPQITYRIKGRRCLDPRDNTVNFTENPALQMYDFVTNDEFGMGVQMFGAEAAANACDSDYMAFPRARAGIVLQDALEQNDILALFALYAEVLWSYDGRDVSVIPDMPVDETYPIDKTCIRDGSLVMSTVGLEQIPTLVRIMFTDRDGAEGWESQPAEVESPEYLIHNMPQAPSTIDMRGIFNRFEAQRRAYQRLARLQTPGRIEWQMFAPGLQYQAGDVVELPDIRGLQSVQVRLTSQPEMIAPSLWQMGGEIYDVEQYPESVGGVLIPEGGIVIWNSGRAIPAGWEAWGDDGGDRLIREGVPGAYGSDAPITIAGETEEAGEHEGDMMDGLTFLLYDESYFPRPPNLTRFLSGSYHYAIYNPDLTVLSAKAGKHAHGYSVDVDPLDLYDWYGFRWAKKVNGDGLMPPGMAVFADGRVRDASLRRVGSFDGYYVGASDSRGKRDSDSQITITSSFDGEHIHGVEGSIARSVSSGQTQAIFFNENNKRAFSGEHSHEVILQITATLKSVAMALYEAQAADGALAPERSVIGWEGDNLPNADWQWADGSNGTVDLRDHFIKISNVNEAGQVAHESSEVTFLGSTNTAGAHKHENSSRPVGFASGTTTTAHRLHHENTTGAHTHPVPPAPPIDTSDIIRYQLRFIQYIGD